MAQAILLRGGAGGVTSDDVTARREHVLQGYTALTADGDDEPAEGGIQIIDASQNNYTKTRTTEYGLDKSRSAFYMHLPQRSGYYTRSDNKPHVEIDSSLLGDALSSDVVDTKTATSKNGVAMRGTLQYKGNGGASNGVVCPEMFYYTLEGAYTARFDAGAYYNAGERGQWKPYVSVPVWMVKQATNYHPEKTLSDTVTCNERGQIKMVNTQDNGYAVNQAKFFALDPPRGKLVMGLGHGNAYYHRNDNNPHVEVDASELGDATADKVMRGFTATSKYGIKFTGTMPDYSSGRTVFNGATFDGILATGVANKAFFIIRDFYAFKLGNLGYTGIRDGGINLTFNTDYTPSRGRRVGFMLSQSNNLSPFRSVVVSYTVTGTIIGTPSIDLTPFVASVSALRRQAIEIDGSKIDGFSQILTHKVVSHLWSQTTGQIVLDISGVNEQAFLGFHAYTSVASDRERFVGDIRITKIDFLN